MKFSMGPGPDPDWPWPDPSGPGPLRARARACPLWTGAVGGEGQGQKVCGPALEGQGQVQKNWAGPGPDRTSDSLVLRHYGVPALHNIDRDPCYGTMAL